LGLTNTTNSSEAILVLVLRKNDPTIGVMVSKEKERTKTTIDPILDD